jgi:ABC-type glycerol-3-phosphate transport system substrate-binding protein
MAKNLPDIMNLFPGGMATLGEYNALYDLRPLIEKYGGPEYVAETGPQGPYLGEYKGKILGATWGYFVQGIFYNKDYFDKNNIVVPNTWDEFEKLLLSLKAQGVVGMEPWFNMADGPTSFPYDVFGWRLVGAGGKLADSQGKPLFNSPEGATALSYWARLVSEGVLGPNPTGNSIQQGRGDFCSGKVPMILDGPWIKATCDSLGGDFTIGMFPHLCGEKTCGVLALPQYLAIGANSKHPEAAFLFAKYMESNAVTTDWANTFGMTTTNPAFFALPANASDPIFAPMAVQFADKDNGVYPLVPNEDAIDRMMMEEFQKVVLQNEPVDTALKNMESQWLSLMAIAQ